MTVKAHRYFERDGNDLYCVIPISMTQSSLGGDLEVQTIDGIRIKVKIPSGVQHGKMLRVKGRGVPYLNSKDHRGDMYIKLQIETPKRLSMKAKTLMRELADVLGEDPAPNPVPLTEL